MKRFRTCLSLFLVLPLLLVSCPVDAAVAPVADEAPAPAQTPDAADLRSATDKLLAAGLTPEEASARVAAMSPAEVAHAAHPDTEIRRGGDAAGVLLFFLILGLFIFVVLEIHHSAHKE